MTRIRDPKTGQYARAEKKMPDCKKEIDFAIKEWLNENAEVIPYKIGHTLLNKPKKEETLSDHRKFAEILFIYVATMFVIVAAFYILFRW